MTTAAAVTAIAPWYGSKRKLAPRIIDALGPHRCYWEPFCGSMSVLLAKPPATMETVNDLHGDLVNLARVIQCDDLAPEFYARLVRTWPSEEVFRQQASAWKAAGRTLFDEPDTERAFRFFVSSWLGMNGMAGTESFNQGFAARYTANGGSPGTRFANAVNSIPAWNERLRKVTILNRDAFDLLGRIEDSDGVAIYCDPPYLTKGSRYVHDFADADHAKLAAAVSRFQRTRVVVSYYEHPELARLYPDWRKIDCSTAKSMVNSGSRPGRKPGGAAVIAPEVLLVNKPVIE